MKYLVVANQTLDHPTLLEVMQEHAVEEGGGAEFHVAVPATSPQDERGPAQGDAEAVARERLDAALSRFHAAGLAVTGEVGPTDPAHTVENALAQDRYGCIIITTLPTGISRWLHADLPHRVARRSKVRVEWIETAADRETRATVNSITPGGPAYLR